MRVVLVGLGGIGMGYDLDHPDRVHTHARAVMGLRPARFYAVDPDPEARHRFEQRYRAPAYAHLDDLPSDVGGALIILASPTSQHVAQLDWALARRPSLVLLEKPVAESLEALDEADRLVASADCPVMVNLIRNYDAGTRDWMAKVPPTGEVTCTVHYSKGLIHNGIHFLTLLMKTFGAIDRIEVLSASPDRPVIRARIGRATVYFHPNEPGSSLNGLSVRQGALELGWLDGGRELLEVGPEGARLVVNAAFQRYQAQVLEQAVRVMAGAPDDSYALARDAQRAMLSLLTEESSR